MPISLRSIQYRTALTAAVYPAVVTLSFILLVILWRVASLPTPEELTNTIETLFNAHGCWIVGVAAFLEGVAVINLYFPGSLVVVLGVTSSLGNPSLAFLMVAVTILGFFLSSLLNYAIGYFGFHKLLLRIGGRKWFDQTQTWHKRHGCHALLLAYVHPNIGGLMAMACGNARLSLLDFIRPTILSILLWNTCWGFAAYSLAPTLRAAAANTWPIILGLTAWTLATFLRELLRKPFSGAAN